MRARIAKIAAAALLAAGSAAVIVATASASEDVDTPVPVPSTSGQPEPGSTLTESPGPTLAPEPGSTTAPPEPGSTTTPPPDRNRTTAPPPEPGRTSKPPEQDEPSDRPQGYSGTASFFSANGVPGACGQQIRDGDLVVALDYRMFGSGTSQCGRKVEITHNGRSITATVLDAAPTTEAHGLDLTRGAYEALASPDQGTIDITWRFVQ
ncbi:RlpA-like double-psi beta-barrel domain-containing protein [Streptomyces sp. NPDC127117]|uniref:RlpA-like double-psi beta-barrel domain-containing protein n=1 Tax=Streptomyces sp. NPDC127117 TaxID=3345368 RepID=UPI003624AE2F